MEASNGDPCGTHWLAPRAPLRWAPASQTGCPPMIRTARLQQQSSHRPSAPLRWGGLPPRHRAEGGAGNGAWRQLPCFLGTRTAPESCLSLPVSSFGRCHMLWHLPLQGGNKDLPCGGKSTGPRMSRLRLSSEGSNCEAMTLSVSFGNSAAPKRPDVPSKIRGFGLVFPGTGSHRITANRVSEGQTTAILHEKKTTRMDGTRDER